MLADTPLKEFGGVQTYVRDVGRWLSSRGHEIYYLSPGPADDSLLNSYTCGKAIPVQFNGSISVTSLIAHRRDYRSVLEIVRPDVVHVQLPHSPLFSHRILLELPDDCGAVGTFHVSYGTRASRVVGRALAHVLSRSIHRLDSVASVSTVAQEDCLNTFQRTSVIIPPLMLSDAGAVTTGNCYDVAFVGKLTKRKSPMTILRAVTRIRETFGTRLNVCIIGDGPLMREMRQYVVAQGIAETVTFAGEVDDQARESYLCNSRFAVFPSLSGESYGLVLDEAMNAGSIVFAGDNPGYRSTMAGMEERLFDGRSVNSLVNLLVAYLSSPGLVSRAKAAQLRRVHSYEASRGGFALEEMYACAMLRGGSSSQTV